MGNNVSSYMGKMSEHTAEILSPKLTGIREDLGDLTADVAEIKKMISTFVSISGEGTSQATTAQAKPPKRKKRKAPCIQWLGGKVRAATDLGVFMQGKLRELGFTDCTRAASEMGVATSTLTGFFRGTYMDSRNSKLYRSFLTHIIVEGEREEFERMVRDHAMHVTAKHLDRGYA